MEMILAVLERVLAGLVIASIVVLSVRIAWWMLFR
jgi:hypothetical protein